MQEIDIWQSLAANAQSCIMTLSKDKGNGKWKDWESKSPANSFNLHLPMQPISPTKNVSDFTNLLVNQLPGDFTCLPIYA